MAQTSLALAQGTPMPHTGGAAGGDIEAVTNGPAFSTYFFHNPAGSGRSPKGLGMRTGEPARTSSFDSKTTAGGSYGVRSWRDSVG